jgi:hypothetical protein
MLALTMDDESFLTKALRDLHNDDRDRLLLDWERHAPRMGSAVHRSQRVQDRRTQGRVRDCPDCLGVTVLSY